MATVANKDGGDVAGNPGVVTDKALTKPSVENAGDPLGAVTPEFAGQILLDTTNGALYYAEDITSDSWVPASRTVNK